MWNDTYHRSTTSTTDEENDGDGRTDGKRDGDESHGSTGTTSGDQSDHHAWDSAFKQPSYNQDALDNNLEVAKEEEEEEIEDSKACQSVKPSLGHPSCDLPGQVFVPGKNLDDQFWKSTFDQLFRDVQKAFQESSDLDQDNIATSLNVVREVLHDSAVMLMKETGRGQATKEFRSSSIFLPFDAKDFWGISSLSTCISYENESGRHSHSFPSGSSELPSGLTFSTSQEIVESHPREFVSYVFDCSLSGRKHLESEARSLWADGLVTPIRVNRRYKEFHRLWKRLSMEYNFRIGATGRVKLLLVPELPSKDTFSLVSSQNRAFVNNRRRSLEIWLRFVSLHRIMSLSAPFRQFILEPVSYHGADTNSEMDDAYSTNSDSVSNTTPSMRSAMNYGAIVKEDPLVARRARQLVDEALAKHGSGPLAISAMKVRLPNLRTATNGAKHKVRHLITREHALERYCVSMGKLLLSLSREFQKNLLQGTSTSKLLNIQENEEEEEEEHEQKQQRTGNKQRKNSTKQPKTKMLLDPLNMLAMALSRSRSDMVISLEQCVESMRSLELTLRFWDRSIYPSMERHANYVYSTELEERQREEQGHSVTPAQRLAAEWHEMTQVRCCMLTKAVEDVVQARIVHAAKQRAYWEHMKERIMAFDLDQFVSNLGKEDEILERGDTNSESTFDAMRAHDEGSPPGFLNAAFEQREQEILERHRVAESERRERELREHREWLAKNASVLEERRPPPPVPKPAIPRRSSQQAIKTTGQPVIRRRAETSSPQFGRSSNEEQDTLFPTESESPTNHAASGHGKRRDSRVTFSSTVTVNRYDDYGDEIDENSSYNFQNEADVSGSTNPFNDESEEPVSNWIDAETDEGIPYVFHRLTRQTRWVRPDPEMEQILEKRIQADLKASEERFEERLRELNAKEKHDEQLKAQRDALNGKIDAQVGLWKRRNNNALADMIISLPEIASSLPSFVSQAKTTYNMMRYSPEERRLIRVDSDFRRKAYLRAIRIVHPDKLPQSVDLEQMMLAERLFHALTAASAAEAL